MDYNKIIIILVVILVGVVVAGFLMFNPMAAKTGSVLSITSANELSDGDQFSISLTDVNGTPIAKQAIHIFITDSNGKVSEKSLTTDNAGNGEIALNGFSEGQYSVNVTFNGNENYTNSSALQKLTIKEKVTQQVSQQSSTPYLVRTSEDGCVMYWSDGHVSYRGETGEPITKEQYEYLKTYGKQ